MKVAIVLSGLLCILVVGLFISIGDPDLYEELEQLAARFDCQPSRERLRDLLNYPADGAYSYYQIALTGAAFTRYPETFRSVSEDLRTERERLGYEQLRSLGARVFEYHPELKPTDFEERLKAHFGTTK